MLVLLSSWYRPRYKEDILRCLAAPIGTELQFRYDCKYVAPALLEKIRRHDGQAFGRGVVCFLDHTQPGIQPLLPVREVDVQRIQEHGSTTTIIFKVGPFASAESAKFTEQLHTISGRISPVKSEDKIDGSYFFEIESVPGSLQTGATVRLWEAIVAALASHPAFQSEPFFWSILAANDASRQVKLDQFHPWPQAVTDSHYVDVLIYHFHPRNDPMSRSTLSLTAGQSLQVISPPHLTIDSRYDLKKFRLKPHSGTATTEATWIRLETAAGWDLDIPVTIHGNRIRMVGWIIITGVLIALSSIMHSLESIPLPAQIIGSIAFGLLAATAVLFRIERVEGV